LVLNPGNSVWVAAVLFPLICMYAKRRRGYIALAALYVPFLFAFCSINEYRLFNILIPVFLLAYHENIKKEEGL